MWRAEALDEPGKTGWLGALRRWVANLVMVFCFFLVVAGVLSMALPHSHEGGNISAAKAQIKQFGVALKAYKLKFGALPTGLDGLLKPPSGDPIMIAKEVPLDPWGNPYRYSLVGLEGYVVVSLGADGEEGGDDEDADIRSDEIENESAQ
jgi:general secretion pathway protein G